MDAFKNVYNLVSKPVSLTPMWVEDPPENAGSSDATPDTVGFSDADTARNIPTDNTMATSPNQRSGKTRVAKAGVSVDKKTAQRKPKKASPKKKKEPTMAKTELKNWVKWYESTETLEEYLRDEADDPNFLLEPFYPCLAELMFNFSWPNLNFYDKCYEEQYVWAHKRQRSDDSNSHTDDSIDFENGSYLMMSIKDDQGEWQEWLYLAKSNYGTLGVFTARPFPKGAPLGFYLGDEVWRADSVGTLEPTPEFLRQQGVPESPCLCSVRDAEGRLVVRDPQRIEPGNNPYHLFLGMHYVKGIEERGVPRRPNCQIIEDGTVVTHFPLEAHEELIAGVLK
eukprot:scaffold7349_cov173-Amphora_coffeaeformis.AAC.30